MGEEAEEEKVEGNGESMFWVLCLEAFVFLAGRNPRGGLREGFSGIFTCFPGVFSQGCGLF